jgi:MoaA/NifB/PqqE/SkfB family radical SAM enzyme
MTITKLNFGRVVNEDFIDELISYGCELIGFLEYLPFKDGTKDLVITHDQRKQKSELINYYRTRYSKIFIDLPRDEDLFGGCLSGLGFVHVSSEGNLEPCVFSTASDSNLKTMSLIEALKSPLLKSIRERDSGLKTTKRGCALWNNPVEARVILSMCLKQN